jgi:hypothetical protein
MEPVGITNRELAGLLHYCAQEMAADDKRRLDAGEEYFHGAASGPSARGHTICVEIGGEVFGHILYYLLAYTWNDVLDWADEQLKGS